MSQIPSNVFQFSCCGKTGPRNYGFLEAATLPAECCSVGSAVCTVANAYQTGCTDMLLDYYDKSHKIIGGVAIGVACVEVSYGLHAAL